MKNEISKGFNKKYILGRSSLNILDCFVCAFLSIGILYILAAIFFSLGLLLFAKITAVRLIVYFFSLFVLVLIWSLLERNNSYYELLHKAVLRYILLLGAIFLINPCGVIITFPILKILEYSNSSYLKQYNFTRKIESLKVFIAFYGTVVFSVFALFLTVLVSIGQFSLSSIIILPVSIVFNFYIFYKIFKSYRAAKNIQGLEILQGKYKEMIDQRLQIIIEKLPLTDEKDKLTDCEPQYLLEANNYSATPSMVVSSSRLNIIFPLGYFKVIKTNPEAADAMLAHEFAHYLHKDSNFLLWVRCYYKSVSKVTYFVIISAIAKLVLDSVLEPNFMKMMVPIVLFFTLVAFVIQELIMLFLRRRVEVAEALADVFAAIATSPQAVAQFLEHYIESDESLLDRDFYEKPLHPSTNYRLKVSSYLVHSVK